MYIMVSLEDSGPNLIQADHRAATHRRTHRYRSTLEARRQTASTRHRPHQYPTTWRPTTLFGDHDRRHRRVPVGIVPKPRLDRPADGRGSPEARSQRLRTGGRAIDPIGCEALDDVLYILRSCAFQARTSSDSRPPYKASTPTSEPISRLLLLALYRDNAQVTRPQIGA